MPKPNPYKRSGPYEAPKRKVSNTTWSIFSGEYAHLRPLISKLDLTFVYSVLPSHPWFERHLARAIRQGDTSTCLDKIKMWIRPTANKADPLWTEIFGEGYESSTPLSWNRLSFQVTHFALSDTLSHFGDILRHDAFMEEYGENYMQWTVRDVPRISHEFDLFLKRQQKRLLTDEPGSLQTVWQNSKYDVVALLDQRAHTVEGLAMRHCVAGYYGRDSRIFSIRDKKGAPVATFQVRGLKIAQIRGFANSAVSDELSEIAERCLKEVEMKWLLIVHKDYEADWEPSFFSARLVATRAGIQRGIQQGLVEWPRRTIRVVDPRLISQHFTPCPELMSQVRFLDETDCVYPEISRDFLVENRGRLNMQVARPSNELVGMYSANSGKSDLVFHTLKKRSDPFPWTFTQMDTEAGLLTVDSLTRVTYGGQTQSLTEKETFVDLRSRIRAYEMITNGKGYKRGKR